MSKFTVLPVHDDVPGVFRYDSKGRGRRLVQPLIIFLVSFVSGMTFSVLTGRPIEQPVLSTTVLITALISLIAVFILKSWSIKKMNTYFVDWLRDSEGLVPMGAFHLGDKGTHSFKSLRTEEVVAIDFFIGKQIVESKFAGIPYSFVYDTVMLDRVTVPPAPTN